jgi:hypothetical protein
LCLDFRLGRQKVVHAGRQQSRVRIVVHRGKDAPDRGRGKSLLSVDPGAAGVASAKHFKLGVRFSLFTLIDG